jgi:hypothetical protein
MTRVKSNRTFALGQLCMTRGVSETIPVNEVWAALARHQHCDWGDVGEEDWELNDAAVEHGDRLLSVYQTQNAIRFWIITEWDRSVTTVLLPEDY